MQRVLHLGPHAIIYKSWGELECDLITRTDVVGRDGGSAVQGERERPDSRPSPVASIVISN